MIARPGDSLRLLGFAVVVIALAGGPREAATQQAAVSVDVVVRLFEAGLSGNAVMNELRGRCLDFRVGDPAAEERLRTAGADDAFLEQLRGLCYTPPPSAAPAASGEQQLTLPPLTVSAGGAAMRSVLVPGLGQFSSGRPLAGAFFLAAAGGALAAGLLSESVTVYCLAPVTGDCPHNQIAEEVSESKMALGLAGFAAVAVASALEAYSGVNRINRSRTAAASAGDHGPRATITLGTAEPRPGRDGVRLSLLRISF